MKKGRLLTATAASAALVLLSSQAILAQHGADDTPTSTPVAATPTPAGHDATEHSGGETTSGGSSGSGTSGKSTSTSPGATTKTPEPEHINSVELTHEAGDTIASKLSDDSSAKVVRVERKNGKSIRQTLVNGKVQSETELKGGESVSVSSTDSSGKKRTVKIKLEGDHFKLVDGAATAGTKFPVTVDAKSDKLLVVTGEGTVELKLTPAKAEDELADKLDQITSAEVELEHGTTTAPLTVEDNPKPAAASTSVVLRAEGVKHVSFLGIFPLDAHETASVNVVTGVEKVESKPWFLNIFGFLFSGK
ncbi:MAG: hypothetical protein JWN01_785 [Patescibacteria group bacterium]|nr:hypothetical protein [Patescibacteria group bacterium]